ncbi:hypothetical protein D9619_012365 [Psilocybe cf. subviscida]|uniref:F-box domain-containing protein n=1 Tax=Psilocybe cf. subviscida TaxID=2480587 RepID=A0A8H5ER92_9AGAR|nr:hypothetical protein D9619_012365 [Psilocybe cf. subviscida]
MDRRSRSIINEELGELEKRIHTLRLREDEIQAVIESMYRLKDSVSTERLGLQRKALELQAEREPINWLPPELLIHIFTAFCDLDSTENTQRAPLILSHVCRKWRNITIHTPHLWRRVLMQMFTESEQDIVQTQLKHSATVPLEIAFRSARRNMPNSEVHQVANLLVAIKAHLQRTELFILHCNNVLPFVYLAPVLKNHIARFPLLHDLALSVGTLNPTFLEALSLLNARWPQDDAEPKGNAVGYMSPLRRLKLDQIPLFSIPKLFVANLQTLELSFPESRSQARHQYRLKMSVLGRFLCATPLLEELILNNTLPIFDTIIPIPKDTTTSTSTAAAAGATDSTNSHWIEMAPIKLEHLKSIDWTFATSSAVHELFAFLHTPSLERLDLWIERTSSSSSSSTANPRDINYIRDGLPAHADGIDARPPVVRGVLDFPCLRELDLQYPGEDTLASVLRRLRMPLLERAAFTEVETDPAGVLVSAVVSDMAQAQGSLPRAQGRLRSRPPSGSGSGSASKPSTSSASAHRDHHTPTFPRLESILFDPRLTHLTHLTLSHQRIPRDAQRAEAMLGYMPVLSSLELDACTGVRWLLEGLQELVMENGGRVGPGFVALEERGEGKDGDATAPRVRRGVKVCPRLEALSFWNCPDVDSASVRKVVLARNRHAGAQVAVGDPEGARQDATARAGATVSVDVPSVAGGSGTGIVIAGDSPDGIGAAGNTATPAPDAGIKDSEGNPGASAVGQTGPVPEPATTRKIKPLRRPRSELAAAADGVPCQIKGMPAGAGGSARLASTNIVSKMIAIEESFRPARIIYLRVSNCVLIDEDDLLALRDLDVVDVIWAGQEID